MKNPPSFRRRTRTTGPGRIPGTAAGPKLKTQVAYPQLLAGFLASKLSRDPPNPAPSGPRRRAAPDRPRRRRPYRKRNDKHRPRPILPPKTPAGTVSEIRRHLNVTQKRRRTGSSFPVAGSGAALAELAPAGSALPPRRRPPARPGRGPARPGAVSHHQLQVGPGRLSCILDPVTPQAGSRNHGAGAAAAAGPGAPPASPAKKGRGPHARARCSHIPKGFSPGPVWPGME